jgi:alkane 1-monooxygenase
MMRPLRYLTPYFLFVLAYFAFTKNGFYCWVPLAYLFFVIPICELFIAPNSDNLSEEQEQAAKSNLFFDLVLWLTVPMQLGALYLFLTSLNQGLSIFDTAGRVVTMGLLCGTFGINAPHELGHRVNKFEQFLA